MKGEIDQRPKRFYQQADVAPANDGWAVALDGKPLRTPAKRGLILPNRALAQVLADEWNAQGERIDLATMHGNRLANVALDHAPAARADLVAEAARYAETDLVCHLAERPGELVRRQDEAWAPLRAWAETELGVRLIPVEGIIAARQPAESIAAVRDHAATLDVFRLTALVHAIALFGSAVIGLAVERGRISAVEAHRLSLVDEDFQISQWGEDAEAARRRKLMLAEAMALDLWFDALRTSETD
ncbi:MAG: ATPase [Alphaproteobacteria bacterium]|nr:ATPase [Alphaproteobacteria bacterium]